MAISTNILGGVSLGHLHIRPLAQQPHPLLLSAAFILTLCSSSSAPGSRLLAGSIFSTVTASAAPRRPAHGCVMWPGCSACGRSEPGCCDSGTQGCFLLWPKVPGLCGFCFPSSCSRPYGNRTHFLLPLLPVVGRHVALVALRGRNCLGLPWFGMGM